MVLRAEGKAAPKVVFANVPMKVLTNRGEPTTAQLVLRRNRDTDTLKTQQDHALEVPAHSP